MKKKNNIRAIQSEIWKIHMARALLIGALLGAAAVFSSLGRHPAYRSYYVGVGILLFLACLIIGIIRAAMQASTVKQRAGIPAYLPFAEDELHPVKGSKTIYLGSEWLLWKNGLDCWMFPKEMIEKDYVYGSRRPGMVKGFMALKLRTASQPVLLMYSIQEEDAVGVINSWLEESRNGDVIDAEVVPDVVYCPYCGAANKPSSRFCQNCGAPIKRL